MSLENETKPVEEEKDDLEDFFSKKDKKVKKKKKKKNVDLDASSDVKSKSKKEETPVVLNENKVEDEEWNDFEEETKDYSDLKVQNYQISEEPAATEEVEKEYNEAGELMESKTNEVVGPWNKTLSSTQETEVVSAPTPPPEPVKTGAYRPPSMRSGGDSGLMRRQRTKQQQAPEINSVMDFPTLNAAAQDKEEKGFEVVKSGAKATSICNNTSSITSSSNLSSSATQPWRSRRQLQQASSTLTTSNQFSALNSSRY